MNEDIYILGIESSCDETAAAVVKNGREVLSNIIASQVPIHRKYGGVVPEIASRNHIRNVLPVIDEALAKAQVPLEKIRRCRNLRAGACRGTAGGPFGRQSAGLGGR